MAVREVAGEQGTSDERHCFGQADEAEREGVTRQLIDLPGYTTAWICVAMVMANRLAMNQRKFGMRRDAYGS
jgi:hypothetical protein